MTVDQVMINGLKINVANDICGFTKNIFQIFANVICGDLWTIDQVDQRFTNFACTEY